MPRGPLSPEELAKALERYGVVEENDPDETRAEYLRKHGGFEESIFTDEEVAEQERNVMEFLARKRCGNRGGDGPAG